MDRDALVKDIIDTLEKDLERAEERAGDSFAYAYGWLSSSVEFAISDLRKVIE